MKSSLRQCLEWMTWKELTGNGLLSACLVGWKT